MVSAACQCSQVRVIKGILCQKTGVLLSASCLLKSYDFEAKGISDATLEMYVYILLVLIPYKLFN